MLKNIIAGLTLTITTAGSAFAGIPLVTDDTGTQGAGGNQIEVTFARDKAANDDQSSEFALVYTRGLTATIDAFIEKGRQTFKPSGGTSASDLGNTVIGAKWRAWENENKTSFALKAAAALPLNETKEAEGFGTGKFSYEATLILTQEMSWGAVNANLSTGQEKYRVSTSNADTSHFSVAPIFNLTEQVKLAIDLGIDHSKTDAGTEKSRYAEIGIMYAPSESVDLGLGFIRTTDQASKSVTKTITGGLAWRF